MNNTCVSVKQIISHIKKQGLMCVYDGDIELWVSSFGSLEMPKHHALYWVKDEKKKSEVLKLEYLQSVFIVPYDMELAVPTCGVIRCDNPKMAFFSILDNFWTSERSVGVGNSSIIKTKIIGKNVSIGEHCYLSEDVILGENVVIGNNVTINNKTIVGDNTIIHSGVTIGEDGLGMIVGEDGIPNKVTQFGGVVIGKGVEIFSNATIMRGAIKDTIIGDFCKIGTTVTIGHNVNIGAKTMIMAGVNVCGSVDIGSRVYIGAGAVLKNQLVIGDGVFIGMGAVVDCDVENEASILRESRAVKKKGSAELLRRMVGIKNWR